MRKIIVALFLLIASPVYPSDLLRKCESIRSEMPAFRVEKILPGPVPGMCEIWAGGNVIYYYPDRKLLFFGEIWDTRGHNFTQRSRDMLLAEKIEKLDLRAAIRWGRGPVRVIFITDPDCPYCRKTEKFLLSPLFQDKITAYVFLYPLTSIHPNAEKHSLQVLSSKKPVETLLALARGKKISSVSISKEAERRLRRMRDQIEKLSVNAVPVIIVGKEVIRGANLERILNSISSQLAKK